MYPLMFDDRLNASLSRFSSASVTKKNYKDIHWPLRSDNISYLIYKILQQLAIYIFLSHYLS